MTHMDETMKAGGYDWNDDLKCWTRPTDDGTEVFRQYGLILVGEETMLSEYADQIKKAFPDTLPSSLYSFSPKGH